MERISNPGDLARLVRSLSEDQRRFLSELPQIEKITEADGLRVLEYIKVDPASTDLMADWLRWLLPGMDLVNALAYAICGIASLPRTVTMLSPVSVWGGALRKLFSNVRKQSESVTETV